MPPTPRRARTCRTWSRTGTRTHKATALPREAIVSDWQREHFPYSPYTDASLVCQCGRERLEIQLVEVEDWREHRWEEETA
jgi:hypothetical protein